MIRIGCSGQHFRVPGLVGGNLVYMDSARLRGRCFTLSFLPLLSPREHTVLEQQARGFERENVSLLAVMDEGALFSGPWCQDAWPRGLIPISDPLGRLARSFGILSPPSGIRCHSFVVDPTGLLQYHLVHDLNGRGMAALLDIVKAKHMLEPPRAERQSAMLTAESPAGSGPRTATP